MKLLAMITFILFGFVSGAGALPSAPKVNNCAVFLGASSESKSNSLAEQLATSYIKILEWLLERKLITLEEAQDTMSSASPTVPQNYIGLSENYHAANQGLKMLAAQMTEENSRAWNMTQQKGKNLLQRLNNSKSEIEKAKLNTQIIYSPTIIDTIELKKLISTNYEMNHFAVLGASGGRVAWAFQDKSGQTWAGINKSVLKLPKVPEGGQLLELFEVRSGAIILAMDDYSRRTKKTSILLYELTETKARPIVRHSEIFRHSFESALDNGVIVWQGSDNQINMTFASELDPNNEISYEPAIKIVTLTENQEKILLNLKETDRPYPQDLHLLNAKSDRPLLAFGIRKSDGLNESWTHDMAILDLTSNEILDRISLTPSTNATFSKVITEYPNGPELFITKDNEQPVFYAFAHKVESKFSKHSLTEGRTVLAATFFPNGEDSIEAWSKLEYNKPLLGTLHRINGKSQSMDQTELESFHQYYSIKVVHPKFGIFYLQVESNELTIFSQKERSIIRTSLFGPVRSAHEIDCLIQVITTPEGLPRLLLKDSKTLLINVIALESEMNE